MGGDDDRTSASSLTGMRADIWDLWLKKPSPAGSFGALHPDETAIILHGIEHGVAVDFTGDRESDRSGRNHPMSAPFADKVRKIIADDVAALKKAGPFARRPTVRGRLLCVSPIGAVPKRGSDKVRMIHDLSYPRGGDSVNSGIDNPYLPISSFGHAARAVLKMGRGCLLIKLDVEAAYRQIPVRPEDWHLLGFFFEGKWYYERVLPFGLRSSCRLWDMFAAALHWLCQNVVRCEVPHFVVHYVDDFLFVVQSTLGPNGEPCPHAASLLRRTLELCAVLGIPMAESKTEGPTTCLTFLGIELDTVAMEARLPPSRLAELQLLIVGWQSRKHASVKELQSLTGLLNFACSVVRPGRFYLRRIINHTTHVISLCAAAHGKRGHLAPFPLTKAVMEDLRWWADFLPSWNGVSLLYEEHWSHAPLLQLYTDACLAGYGAYFQGAWVAGTWSPEIIAAARRTQRASMPFLELTSLVIAAGTWGHLWGGKKITFWCDCKPVVDALRKCSSRSPEQMHLLRQMATIACRRGFDFKVHHISGESNTVADALSRYGDCQLFRTSCPDAQLLPTSPVFPSMPPPRPLPPQQGRQA